jgi:hypothetical protein
MTKTNPSLTLEALRALARTHGLHGYSHLRKAELLKLLAKHGIDVAADPTKAARATKRPTKPATKSQSRRKPLLAAEAENEEQRVEAAKFSMTPTAQRVATTLAVHDLGENIEHLPDIRSPYIVLLPQKPGVLHASWHIPESLVDTGARLRLAQVQHDHTEVLAEFRPPSARGHWYFHVPVALPLAGVYLHLGLYDTQGRFISALPRAIARIPSLYGRTRAERAWRIDDTQIETLVRSESLSSRLAVTHGPQAPSSPFGKPAARRS